MDENVKIEKFKINYLKEVKRIYNEAFPIEERMSLKLLIFNLIRKCELYVLFENNKICGFTYLINHKGMTFILYLAIDKTKRGKGYGGYILDWCSRYKKDKVIYLNIDELNDKFSDIEIRNKRLKFYTLHSFKLTDYLSVEEKCNFNILVKNGEFDYNNYIKLDERIAKIFFDKKSNIKKVT